MEARGVKRLSALFLYSPFTKTAKRGGTHSMVSARRMRERWASRRLTCFLQNASQGGRKSSGLSTWWKNASAMIDGSSFLCNSRIGALHRSRTSAHTCRFAAGGTEYPIIASCGSLLTRLLHFFDIAGCKGLESGSFEKSFPNVRQTRVVGNDQNPPFGLSLIALTHWMRKAIPLRLITFNSSLQCCRLISFWRKCIDDLPVRTWLCVAG
jgi:hypothetical protein